MIYGTWILRKIGRKLRECLEKFITKFQRIRLEGNAGIFRKKRLILGRFQSNLQGREVLGIFPKFTDKNRQNILTNIIFIFSIRTIHHFQQFHFNLCLIQEGFFVFDNFYSNMTLLLMIERLHHLSKTSFA